MNDSDEVPIKKLIIEALEDCHDTELLDLIYKLIIYNNPKN